MSDFVAAVRKAVAVGAFVIAGAGFLAMVLPFRGEPTGRPRSDAADHVACPTPVANAYEGTGSGADWFEYAPNTSVILNEGALCVLESQRRLSWGAAAMAFGGLVAISQRRFVSNADN